MRIAETCVHSWCNYNWYINAFHDQRTEKLKGVRKAEMGKIQNPVMCKPKRKREKMTIPEPSLKLNITQPWKVSHLR